MADAEKHTKGDDGLVLTVLGCGTMGIAIVSGILASLSEADANGAESAPTSKSGTTENKTFRLPTRYIACVRRSETAKKVEHAFAKYDANVTALSNQNLKGVQEADVVLLGCKPYMFRDILSAKGMKEALAGKLVISVLAGVTVKHIEEHLYGSASDKKPEGENRCRIVRVMPNTASAVRESMTVVETSTPPLEEEQSALITWMFERIGKVTYLAPNLMDAATALCGSAPAFMAIVLEALADGGVAMGITRADAQMMAAQVMRGTSAMVLNGEHPAVLKDKVCSPGGCTIGGVLALEAGGVRGTVSKAVREATQIASGLGKPKS